MSKQTRKEKKEEEARIIAEMEAAMREAQETSASEAQDAPENEPTQKKSKGFMEDATPEILHCKRCKTQMEDGVCPTCGFRVYVPMDEKKRSKIRLIVGAVCVAVFLLLFLLSQIK